MKCPVCKNNCEENQVCQTCGFRVAIPIFINAGEADIWVKTVVAPYQDAYYQKRSKAVLMTIEELNLSNYAYYPLKEAGISTVGELVNKSFDELNNVCSMAGYGWRDLARTLRGLGFTIAGIPSHLQEELSVPKGMNYYFENINSLALPQVNAFAKKWLDIFRNTEAKGYPFDTPNARGAFYDDLEEWGVNADITSLRQSYRDIFGFADNVAFLDDTELFVARVPLLNEIETLSVMICAKWRYRISRCEYTFSMKKWCVAAFERLVELSEEALDQRK